ncbi:hypothetical protein LDENG_00165630 [Lucifuga dentata]|nr:hypothetical protein LDENG_00165630 [Lucifuga dentata]
MLSTGDVQGCLRKLETLLRVIKYPGHVDYNSLSKGDPSAFLPIVSFALTSFSPVFAEQLVMAGLELAGKTDLRFIDTLYKVLRDMFHYKPILSKQQFLQWGFSQRKISVVCDIINLVLQRHKELKKPRVRYPVPPMNSRVEAHPPQTNPDEPLLHRPLVVNHTGIPSTFPTNSSCKEAFSTNEVYGSHHEANTYSQVDGSMESQEEEEEEKIDASVVDGRLSGLEARVESLLSGLDRLSVLEKRLETLERQKNTDKSEEQMITISRETWDNLLSRVLLLETKLELSNTQSSILLPCQAPTSSYSSSSTSDASQEELKDRLERISNMLKSTTSLLKKSESFSSHFS